MQPFEPANIVDGKNLLGPLMKFLGLTNSVAGSNNENDKIGLKLTHAANTNSIHGIMQFCIHQ